MEFDQYIQQSLRTEPNIDQYEQAGQRAANKIRLGHALDGIMTEVGELADVHKRYVYYGKPIDWVNVLEECGDLCWYLAILFDQIECETGQNPSEVLQKNIDKLKARYPEKFTEYNALNRDLSTERSVLEGS